MPFGLNNAASTFKRTMKLALANLQWVTCLINIDDIIVFGKSFEEHMHRVEDVVAGLEMAGLKLRAEKCYILQREVAFLGHMVSGEGIKTNPINIEKIMSRPKSQ